MNWWNIIKRDMEKLRTSTGDRLRVKDVGRFQDLLRTLLIEHVIDDLDQAGRRYKITFKDRQLIGNFYEFSMSIRPKTADGRQVHYNFTLIENDEGDYEYVNIYGPELNLTDEDIIESEYVLDIGLGITIFIIVIFVVLLINKGISKAVSYTGIGGLDKTFGFFFGFIKAYIIAVCIFSGIHIVYNYDKWPLNNDQSYIFPYLEKGSNYLIKEFPNEKTYQDSKEKIKEL